MLQRPTGVHGHVRRARTDVDDADTKFLLVPAEHRFGTCELRENDVPNRKPRPVAASNHVLSGGNRRRHNVSAGLEADSAHSHWIGNAFLAVHEELLGDHMENLTIVRNRERLRTVEHLVHIHLLDLAALDGNHPLRTERADVATGEARIDGLHRHACHHLASLFDRRLDTPDRLIDADDNPLAEAGGRLRANPHDVDATANFTLANHTGDLARPDVEPTDDLLSTAHSVSSPSPAISPTTRFKWIMRETPLGTHRLVLHRLLHSFAGLLR